MTETQNGRSAFAHLELQRSNTQERVWKPTPPLTPDRDHATHGYSIRVAAERAVEQAKTQRRPAGIDPALVLRVRTVGVVDEDLWRRSGFTIVGAESERVLILFSDDLEMQNFRNRVANYEAGKQSRDSQKHPDNNWLKEIEPDGVDALGPEDRVGSLLAPLLKNGGLEPSFSYCLDVELWPVASSDACQRKLDELAGCLNRNGGKLLDSLVRDGLVLARIRIPGSQIDDVLAIPSVATVDLPPRQAYSLREVVRTSLDDIDGVVPPDDDAEQITVVDSGVASGHGLISQAIGETVAVPASLGNGLDVSGHGSAVAGIALYNDIEASRRHRTFRQFHWINAARVTNSDDRFDDERLIPHQIDEAIRYFANHGCRIFNISLVDDSRPYNGGRPSAWAATLDNLASELDVVITVATGNYDHELSDDEPKENWLLNYPQYLLNDKARIQEPSTALNVLSIGSLAGDGSPEWSSTYPNDVPPRLVAKPGQPSPFARCGPGPLGAIKPDLVDLGGNYIYDARTRRFGPDRGCSVVSLNWSYRTGSLFTFSHGSSFAAPRIAHLAARLLTLYPGISANLVRAILAHSAKVPESVMSLSLKEEEIRRLCGFGQPDSDRVLYSSASRVAMVAEGSIQLDRFHVYEVPIPAEYQICGGRRRISVTLAYDPPVRQRRAGYIGNRMSFRLLRGVSLPEVVRANQSVSKGQKKGKYDDSAAGCPLMPGPKVRDHGTLQHGEWLISKDAALAYSEPFYLLVTNKHDWQDSAEWQQRYAVVVSLEHESESVDLYSLLRARTRVSQRARVRY